MGSTQKSSIKPRSRALSSNQKVEKQENKFEPTESVGDESAIDVTQDLFRNFANTSNSFFNLNQSTDHFEKLDSKDIGKNPEILNDKYYNPSDNDDFIRMSDQHSVGSN